MALLSGVAWLAVAFGFAFQRGTYVPSWVVALVAVGAGCAHLVRWIDEKEDVRG